MLNQATLDFNCSKIKDKENTKVLQTFYLVFIGYLGFTDVLKSMKYSTIGCKERKHYVFETNLGTKKLYIMNNNYGS